LKRGFGELREGSREEKVAFLLNCIGVTAISL
jgi:hypothetical protein